MKSNSYILFFLPFFLCLSLKLSADELSKISKKISTHKFVAIGESGHAVAKYHTIRSIIARELILKYKFRNIFVEDNILDGFSINQTLQKCSSEDTTPQELQKSFALFDIQTFKHNEFFPLFKFICDWNKQHPKDTVNLMGMDLWAATWEIRKFLENYKPLINNSEFNDTLKMAKENCFLWSIESLQDYPTHPDWIYYAANDRVEPTRHASCLKHLNLLNSLILNYKINKSDQLKILMIIDTAIANQKIRDIFNTDFSKAMTIRDATQARNTLKLIDLTQNTAGTLFFAHNVHVFNKMSQVITGDIQHPYPWNHVTSSGELLKAHFGSNMTTLGLGGYNIKSLRDGQYPLPTQSDSLDLLLHSKNYELKIIRSRDKPWSSQKWRVHNETDKSGLWINPRDQFDYYIFVNYSEAATEFKPSNFIYNN